MLKVSLSWKSWTSGVLCLALGAVLSSCTYSTPEADHALPRGLEKGDTWKYSDESLFIKKEFFGFKIDEKTKTVLPNKKLWLCGWAPVSQSGRYKNFGTFNASPLNSRHCNMKFDITRNHLVGYERNVNYENYKRIDDEWQVLFTIPITNHFFYERPRDSRGRERNEYAMVTNRGNWQERPFIALNLAGIAFKNYSKAPGVIMDWAGRPFSFPTFLSTRDVEIDEKKEKDFLGFTALNVSSSGSDIQNSIRFNFLEMKENPSFDKTYYHKSTSNFMNILQIVGGAPTLGSEKEKASHWDLSKPIEVCLNGFPEDGRNYKQIAIDVLNEANGLLGHGKNGIKATGHKGPAFTISDKSKFKYKYDYDLRCPSITWIDNFELAMGAPLGIGLSNANTQTGEILWGGAVVWGGLMNYIVNRDHVAAINADAATMALSTDGSSLSSLKKSSHFFDANFHFEYSDWAPNLVMMDEYVLDFMKNQSDNDIHKLVMKLADDEMSQFNNNNLSNSSLLKVTDDNSTLKASLNLGYIETLKSKIANFKNQDVLPIYRKSVFGNAENFVEKIKMASNMGSEVQYNQKEVEMQKIAKHGLHNGVGQAALIADLSKNLEAIQDFDNQLGEHIYQWEAALSQMEGSGDRLAATKSVIKNVMLHEWGHVLGMGHQFEGNRLPERGSVPDELFNKLATKAKNHQNYTSIMDYMSGKTEVNMAYDDVQFQVHDEHVLRYLYNQTFVTFKPGDQDFTHVALEKHGIIPSENLSNPDYKTAYLPQCSDLEAWKAESPYCRRWDRGYDGATIIEETYKEFSDSVINRLNSFTAASGGNPFRASQRLWGRTYSVMNRNRTFYDHMRYLMQYDELYKQSFHVISDHAEAMKSFSKSCVNPLISPEHFKVEFAKLSLKAPKNSSSYQNNYDLSLMAATQPMELDSHFLDLYEKYKSVAPVNDLFEMSDSELIDLEDEMYKNGVIFTEVQKLCLATRRSLRDMKELLSYSGSDHSDIDFKADIVPTGLRGGGARADYSRVFGRYNRLGNLPIKLSTLDLLTDLSSTMRYGYWQIPKPMYSHPEKGKFGYYPLFPIEFTDLITTSVINNMGFGGTEIKDTAELSIANLYMSYFLNRTFVAGNADHHGFNENFLEQLQTQTDFNVEMVAVLLRVQEREGTTGTKAFGFDPEIFNPAANELIKLTRAYALPDGKVIVEGNGNQIILPVTKMRFLDQKRAYVWAFNISYDNTGLDKDLVSHSVKSEMTTKLGQQFKNCIEDGNLGLASYFHAGNEAFEGFTVGNNIASNPQTLEDFFISVGDAFKKYNNPSDVNLKPTQVSCSDSLRGVGLIGATALSLRGFILPQVQKYIK